MDLVTVDCRSDKVISVGMRSIAIYPRISVANEVEHGV